MRPATTGSSCSAGRRRWRQAGLRLARRFVRDDRPVLGVGSGRSSSPRRSGPRSGAGRRRSSASSTSRRCGRGRRPGGRRGGAGPAGHAGGRGRADAARGGGALLRCERGRVQAFRWGRRSTPSSAARRHGGDGASLGCRAGAREEEPGGVGQVGGRDRARRAPAAKSGRRRRRGGRGWWRGERRSPTGRGRPVITGGSASSPALAQLRPEPLLCRAAAHRRQPRRGAFSGRHRPVSGRTSWRGGLACVRPRSLGRRSEVR